MGSQRGARPTYNLPFSPFSPRLLFLPSHRSVPSSFNLAAGAKESGERESPRDTAHLQTSHSCLLPPSSPPRPLSRHLVSLLSPRLSLLPARSRSSSPQFCLRFNFYPPPSSSSRWDPERTTPVMQDTLSFLFCTRLLFIWIWAHQFSMVSFIWTYFTSRIL